MQKFSLINFINQKNIITLDLAEPIVKSLLQPHSFSSKNIEKISVWYQKLPVEEKKLLYNITAFKNALSQKTFLCKNHKISSLWLGELFKSTQYKIPTKFIQQLANSFLFTTIKLPSQVEISVDSEAFFKTILQGINNHPHLIDELKVFFHHAKRPVYIAPENGDLEKEKFLGLFLSTENALYFLADLVNYQVLDTLIHEIGHAADAHKIQHLQEKTSLCLYYDEVNQEAKSILIEAKELNSKQGDDNPFEDLYFYIRKHIKSKYPSLNAEKIERATAFWFKNEIIALASLSKEQLVHALNIWHLNGIRYTDKIFQRIEFLKKQYTNPNDIFHSFKNSMDEMNILFSKRIKKPLFFTLQMIGSKPSFQIFSKNLLNELSQSAGFIEQEENRNRFMLSYCSFKTNENNIALTFDLRNFGYQSILKLQSFYAKRGIFLTQKEKILFTTNHDSIERMSRLIQHFFNKLELENEMFVFHFSNEYLSKHEKKEILYSLQSQKIPYLKIENDFFVKKGNLSDKNLLKYSSKSFLIPIPKGKEHHSNLVQLFESIHLTPRIYTQTEEANNYLLFSQKEFLIYHQMKQLLRDAQNIHQYYYTHKNKSTDIVIPANLYTTMRNKTHQKQKD